MSYYHPKSEMDFNPQELFTACVEKGAGGILLEEDHLPPAVFDLSTGLLGELLHKLSVYRIRLALVIEDPEQYSHPFQAFLLEANQGTMIRSFSNPESAADWLEKG